MDARYTKLGFKQPKYLENPYGIKIYIGTHNQDDWCVEIPKEIIETTSYVNKFKLNNNLGFFMISEEHALEIAERYTRIAKTNAKKGA